MQKELEQVSNSPFLQNHKKSQKLEKSPFLKERLDSGNQIDQAFRDKSRTDNFFECCERGSVEDIEILKRILESNPKK